jgi:hypothetical protein
MDASMSKFGGSGYKSGHSNQAIGGDGGDYESGLSSHVARGDCDDSRLSIF